MRRPRRPVRQQRESRQRPDPRLVWPRVPGLPPPSSHLDLVESRPCLRAPLPPCRVVPSSFGCVTGHTGRGRGRIALAAYPGAASPGILGCGGAEGGQAHGRRWHHGRHGRQAKHRRQGRQRRLRAAGHQSSRPRVPRHGADRRLLHQRARHATGQDDRAAGRHGPALLLRLRWRRLPGLLLVSRCAGRRPRDQRAGGPSRSGRPDQRGGLHEPCRLRRGARDDGGVPRPSRRRRHPLHRRSPITTTPSGASAMLMHPGVFVRSVYFQDPDGILLEFACWMRDFIPGDVAHAPARRPRPRASTWRPNPSWRPSPSPSLSPQPEPIRT